MADSKIKRNQYDDWIFRFRLSSGGEPLNLTGYAFEFAIYDLSDVLFAAVDTGGGGIVLDALNGRATATIARSITALAVPGRYKIYLQSIDPDDDQRTWANGVSMSVLAGKQL